MHNFAHIGEELRTRRDKRGHSLAHMSNLTRIPAPFLNAIESLDRDNLPSMSYALGYVRSYAKELGLSGEFAVDRFKADLEISRIAVHRGPKQSVKRRPMALPKGIFSGLAVSLFAASMAVWFGVHADDVADAGQSLTTNSAYEVREQAHLPADVYRITALRPSLVEIRDNAGALLIRRIFTPGQTWEGSAQAGLTLAARNGSALTLERGAHNFGALSQFGASVDPIDMNVLEHRLTAQSGDDLLAPDDITGEKLLNDQAVLDPDDSSVQTPAITVSRQ